MRFVVRLAVFPLLCFMIFRELHAGESAQASQPAPELAPVKEIAAFAAKHCTSCHDKDTLEGGFDIDDLLKGPTVERSIPTWHAVLERIVARDMPPKKKQSRPTEADYHAVETWLQKQLLTHEAFAEKQRPRPLRRLNRDEYNGTIQQVFGLPNFTPAAVFPPDEVFDGFSNVSDVLSLSSVLVEQYMAAAQAIAKIAINDEMQTPVRKQTFTDQNKDYSLTLRGYDPGGAAFDFGQGRVWLGDHFFAATHSAPGFYKVRLHVTPKNLASHPGYIPHFQFRFNQVLVNRGDLAVREGEESVYEFVAPVYTKGEFEIDMRWANGFPYNNSLRAQDAKDPRIKQSNTWDLIEYDYKVKKAKDAATPYPFPFFTKFFMEVEGPLYPEGWPLSRFQRENAAAITAHDAKTCGEWLLPKLFRRNAKAEEIADFVEFVARTEKALAAAPNHPAPDKLFMEALRQGVARALISPNFLFLVEPGPVGRDLTDIELAARLACFLWSGPPDEELAALARAGTLRPALSKQAGRLLADPRSASFIERFTDEWLGLAKLATIMPEGSLYRRFDNQGMMRMDFAAEPRAMMTHLLRQNGTLFDLLDCDYAFINDRLADHYHLPSNWTMLTREMPGFPTISGGDLRLVKLPEGRRGGLITMAAFLASTSENTRTSPVRRGAWILERLFNRPPPPPPPSVNAVLPDAGQGDTASSLFKSHITAANCAGCHSRIDPLGMALEHYDLIGEWRDMEPAWVDPANPIRNLSVVQKKFKKGEWDPLPDFAIDDSFRMGGIEGKGADAVKKYLMLNKEKFARGFTEKLAMFALGRKLLIADEPELEKIRAAAMKDNFKFQSLILALLESKLFQRR